MTVRVDEDVAFLEGDCGVEDAEALASALDGAASVRVDLSMCRNLHSAVVQALLVFHPVLQGAPDNQFLTRLILPALAGADALGDGSRQPKEQTAETLKSMTE